MNFSTRYRTNQVKNALSATLKIGGTVEATDVFEVTINGTKVAVTAGSTDTSVVASTIASALNLKPTVSVPGHGDWQQRRDGHNRRGYRG